MTLLFAHQVARGPTGVLYEVDGADAVELGPEFGKASVLFQPTGRRVGHTRSRRGMPTSRALGLSGGFMSPLVAFVGEVLCIDGFSPSDIDAEKPGDEEP